jgi:TonB-linked SusC/RagA family outer membrane protein
MAQEKTQLTGIVTSEKGEALSNVSISMVAASTKEARNFSTNEKGLFTAAGLKTGERYEFTFSSVGYEIYLLKNFEMKSGANNSVIIRMKQAAAGLNEVVVIGYGSVLKKDVTGSIASLKSDKIAEIAVTDVTQALQGRISGVVVQTQSWKPGFTSQVRIRGNRSITASNEPLYVLDGIPTVDAIDQLNPNDIESIEVLKDASATAIYGNRGANGVIIITTKKGIQGRTTLEYAGYEGVLKNRPLPRLMNAGEFVEYSREAQRNSLGGTYDPKPNKDNDFKNDQLVATPYMYQNMTNAWSSGTYDPSKLKSTDWLSFGLRTGNVRDHQLTVRAGGEKTRFLMSGDYYDNVGVVRDQDYTRYNVRMNAETTIGKFLKVGTDAVYSHSLQDAGWSDVFDGYGLKSFNPIASPYNDDGTLALFPTNNTRTPNPVTNFGHTKRVVKQDRFLGNYFADVSFLNGFNFRTSLGIDYRSQQNLNFDAANTASAGGQAPSDAINSGLHRSMYTLENILSYRKTFNHDHSFYATLLQSIQGETEDTSIIYVSNLPYDQQLYYNVGSALTINGIRSNYSHWSLASFMGRVNYAFRDKYLATVSARYDGSSRLAEGHKWVLFPSVALAWRLKSEDFLKNVGVLSDLKLRGGWGRTGNSAIAPYKTEGALSIIQYVYGDAPALGFSPLEMINPSLTWETTGQFNAGIDFGLFNGRISGTIDVYKQNTYNLLLSRNLPTVSGFSSILSNVGRTSNEGIEAAITTVNMATKNFEWRTDWIFATNRQKIVELYNGKVDDVGAKWFIGKPVNVFYDVTNAGIWQNTDADKGEIARYNANGSTFKPGDIRPLDRNHDYKIDASDRYIIGQQDPKWTASLGNNFRYKNFDASFLLYAMVGQTVYHDLDMRFDGRYNQPKLDYWTPVNPAKKYPRPLLGTAGLNFISELNYYSGSFMRMKNISVGYSLPPLMLKKTSLQRFRIYASVQNPLVVTKFPGTDPEGATGFNEPSITTYLIGANIIF